MALKKWLRLLRGHTSPGSGSKFLRIPARLRRGAEKFWFKTPTTSKAASMKPCMSRNAEVENAKRLKTEVTFNPQPSFLISLNHGWLFK
jgi:hypothetical protein